MRLLTALCILVGAPLTCHAIPIQWELNGSLFESGSASGSFIYDADTALFSDILLVTSPESPSGGLTFSMFIGETMRGLMFAQRDIAPDEATIALQLNGISQSMLTNAGGILTVNPDPESQFFAEFRCTGAECALGFGSNVTNWDVTASNTLTATPVSVPEPNSLALVLIGIVGFIWHVRQRQRASLV